jgi:hypothetical protein
LLVAAQRGPRALQHSATADEPAAQTADVVAQQFVTHAGGRTFPVESPIRPHVEDVPEKQGDQENRTGHHGRLLQIMTAPDMNCPRHTYQNAHADIAEKPISMDTLQIWKKSVVQPALVRRMCPFGKRAKSRSWQ